MVKIDTLSYLYAGYRVHSVSTGEVKYVWRTTPPVESGAQKIDTMGKILMVGTESPFLHINVYYCRVELFIASNT